MEEGRHSNNPMNCEDFETAWQELEDSFRLPARMEQHRQACSACAELADDLTLITQQARQLLPREQPSERVWEQIQHQLQQGGLIQPAQPKPRWFPRIPVFGIPRLPMGLAYAAVFLVAFGVVSLHSILSNVPVSPSLSPPPAASVAALPEAGSALDDQPLRELMEKIPASKRATYETNLQQVNNAIRQLSTRLESHPEDLFARGQLNLAYEQKELLVERVVRWEEF